MNDRNARPYSLLIPEGGRTASKKTLMDALREARTCNASREARGLSFVRVLERATGRTWDVPPDADCLAMVEAG